MEIRWSPSTGDFYDVVLSGNAVPADAVAVTARRHADLIAGRSSGRKIVANAKGKPELAPQSKPTIAQLRAMAIGEARQEARRRILTVASLERQANDNATMALHVASANPPGPELANAIARRRAIDAIRSASNTLQDKLTRWSAGALSQFDAGADAHWPVKE